MIPSTGYVHNHSPLQIYGMVPIFHASYHPIRNQESIGDQYVDRI